MRKIIIKRNFWVIGITITLAVLLLYTGISKFLDKETFIQELSASPIPEWGIDYVVWGLPLIEIIVAITLLIPIFRLKSLYATLLLMILFTIYIIKALFFDNQLSCSCGGIIEKLSPKLHLLFNSGCILITLAGIKAARNSAATIQPSVFVRSTAILSFGLMIGLLCTTLVTPASPKSKIARKGERLPEFNLLLVDSLTKLSSADIPTGKPIIIMAFSPSCPHCQDETRDLLQYMNNFKNVHLYLLTPYPFRQMKAFYKKLGLEKYSNDITIGIDKGNSFLSHFDTRLVPYTAIYNPKKRLIETFPGKTDIKTITRLVTE